MPSRWVGTRRVTIRTDDSCVDLAMPALTPLEVLIPSVVDALGGHHPVDHAGVRYRLLTDCGVALDGVKTLSQLGVRDGECLMLTCAPAQAPRPPYDDPAETVADVVAALTREKTDRALQWVISFVGAGWLVCAAVLLTRTAKDAAQRGGYAAVISVVVLLAAMTASRLHYRTGLVSGLGAVGFATLTGLLAGGPGLPGLALGAGMAATVATLLSSFGEGSAVFTPVALCAATCSAAGLAGVAVGQPLPATGVGLAVVASVAIDFAPRIAMTLSRLPVDHRAPACEGLRRAAGRAAEWLTRVTVSAAAAAAIGAVSALERHSVLSIVFASAIGLAMILRSTRRDDPVCATTLLLCGTVPLCAATVVFAADHPSQWFAMALVSTLLGLVTLSCGSLRMLPAGWRAVQLGERFIAVAVTPLAFMLCGVFSAARSANLVL